MNIRILMLGDVIGSPGRAMVEKHLTLIKKQYSIDGVIVNGENSADGKGITPKIAKQFRAAGVDVTTTGNHIWQKKDINQYLTENKDVLRPANFPNSCPGTGLTTFECKGIQVGVLNLQGRIFMREHLDCPFRVADSALTYLRTKTNVILVDFHAEATAEKMGFAYYLDGRVSAVVGTHTHVQTADERILPHGTAYITDLGMAGAINSSIGMKKEPIIQHMITQMPVKFMVDTQGPFMMTGVIIEINTATGLANSIERLKVIDEHLVVESDKGD
jgi:metallophosphoesterase (TIGR00282 family)